jgi:hypothetical protein
LIDGEALVSDKRGAADFERLHSRPRRDMGQVKNPQLCRDQDCMISRDATHRHPS